MMRLLLGGVLESRKYSILEAQNEKMHFWKDVNSFKIICKFVLTPVEMQMEFS